MKTFGAYETKTRLSELLDMVEKGESIVITKRGQPVAKIVPFQPDREKIDIVKEFRELRSSVPPLGCTLRELIEEGRRY